MEYKRIWMPYGTDFRDSLMYVSPYDNEETIKVHNELAKLISEGWRIISTAPITESRAYSSNGNHNIPGMGGSDMVYTYTSGIEIFLVKE
jgi:hypothetical protein